MDGSGERVTRRSLLGALAGVGVGTVLGSGAAAAAGGDVVWEFETDAAVRSSPTVSDGTVFVGSQDESVYALDAGDGSQRWEFETGASVSSSPTVADGTVFVGSNDNSVYALDADDGSQRWEFETDAAVRSSPTVADGTVFVGSNDDSVYALDAGDGSQRWEFQTGSDVLSSPTVAAGTVFVGSYDNSVYALDAGDGSELWEFETGDWVSSSPTVAAGTVFVGSEDTSVYALGAGDGSELWEFETVFDVDSSPTVADGTVFVGSQDESVYALDAENGSQRWEFETGNEVYSSPTVADGTVFVGSYDESVYALDAGVSGSSEGSRAMLGTLGHHGDWQYAGQNIDIESGGGLGTTEMAAIGGGGGLALLFGAYALMRRAGDDETETGRGQETSSVSDTPSGEATASAAQGQPNSDEQQRIDDVMQTLDGAERSLDSAAAAIGQGNPEEAHHHLDGVLSTLNGVRETVTEQNLPRHADRIDSLARRHDQLQARVADARGGAPTTIPTTPRRSLSYDDIERGEAIGQGGNADVLRGTSTADGQTVTLAVKEPRMSETLNVSVVERMMEEAETWQQLDDHDHIVSVVDYDSTPVPWIAMEYMDGGHLGERTDEMSFEQKLWTAIVTTKAVRHAHRRGVAHLDLKPENVLLRSVEDAWDVPKVADWGLSKHLLEHSKSIEGLSPQYAAPEQFDDSYGSADDVTDVYQLGSVFYELFTGRPPFEGQPAMVMNQVLNEQPDPPSTVADVPPALDDVLRPALKKSKQDRYDSVLYLRDALINIEDGL